MKDEGNIMRHLLHFGIFVLALAAVPRAEAQENRRRGDRHGTIVIATEGGPLPVRTVRTSVDAHRENYDSRRTVYRPSRANHDLRRAYLDQREDLQQIVRISKRWERATASRDREAQWNVDRRLDAWVAREIRESVREPHNQRYSHRIRILGDELARLERSKNRRYGHPGSYDRGHQGRARHDRGHGGSGHYGSGNHGYHRKKASLLNEFVTLSQRQLRRAEAGVRYPVELSFARR